MSLYEGYFQQWNSAKLVPRIITMQEIVSGIFYFLAYAQLGTFFSQTNFLTKYTQSY